MVAVESATNEVVSVPLDRRRAIEDLLPRVERMARRIARRLPSHVRLDDLISAGTVGLIEAVDRFDPVKCGAIERYADIRVRGAILDELRAMDWATRSLRRQASHVQETVRKLSHELGRAPEAEEVAGELQMDIEEYHRLMERIRPVMVLSFEEMGSGSGGERARTTFLCTLMVFLSVWSVFDPKCPH